MALKRKIDSNAPEGIKTSKSQITEAKKKAMTKNELMAMYNDLLKMHGQLKIVNDDNIKRIDSLETTIEIMKNEDSRSKNEQIEVEVQTDDSETCNECEFPANDIWELGEHIYEFHTLKTFGEFECSFCNEKFGRKKDLMKHRK
jgi:hypothetical protein